MPYGQPRRRLSAREATGAAVIRDVDGEFDRHDDPRDAAPLKTEDAEAVRTFAWSHGREGSERGVL